MRSIDVHVESTLKRTPRVLQLGGMFDVPIREKIAHDWKGAIPIDEREWNVGLIVGPSGAGKSSIKRQLFGEERQFEWLASSVVDDFRDDLPIEKIAEVCNSVGFSTIPSWMKPFDVLSTGEKFRVGVARALIECEDPIVIDEFTSVVDRQVAQIGAHAVQKTVRRNKRKFVAVSCHYDIVDWLQPDWILEPATMQFTWRELRGRPALDLEVSRVAYAAWQIFAPFHYLTAELSRAANCFCLFVGGRPAAFAGVLHRPHSEVDDIKGVSRLVTLPDFQGLGLAFVLVDLVASAYASIGYRLRTYPAHPPLIRSFDRSPKWAMEKKPGKFSARYGSSSSVGAFGGRPNAVFEYVGDKMPSRTDALALIGK